MADNRILVPLSDSVTVRQTVAYAVRSALSDSDAAVVHLVVAVPDDAGITDADHLVVGAESLLDRAAAWVEEDADGESIVVETAVLGDDEYLFGPRDYAETFAAYADGHAIDRIVLDPEYQPGASTPMLQPLERELAQLGLAFEEAPVDRPAQHERLVGSESVDRLVALFGVSIVFYLVLGDPTYWFDWVTGIAVAGIVAVTLSHVTFTTPLQRIESPLRVLRFVVYVPYLLYEIVKANLLVSIVILRPSMPIDPSLVRVNARVRAGLPLLALANSITLTPGTLTVRANDQQLLVHTLVPEAREDLFDGGLERGIRFVFFGRESAAIPSPRERGDTEVVRGEKR